MKRRPRIIVAVAVVAALTQVVLQPASAATFTNSTPISLPGPGATGPPPPTAGVPYPSNIEVSGLAGTVTDVNVTLNGFDCSARGNDFAYPEDVDILLVGPTGTNVILLSDVGGANQTTALQFTNLTITLDDQAASQLPADIQITSGGSYRPTDDDDDPFEQVAGNNDPFSPPAPAPSGNTALSTFNGTAPNGTWSLYVVDDYPGPDNCTINRGWTLDIATTGGPTTTAGPTSTVAPTTTSTVGGPNLAPAVVNDGYTTAMNTTLTVPSPGVLSNDSDPNGDPLTAGMPTQPANGTVVLNSDGSFTYTPNPGFVGTDTWTYMAHDPFGGMTTATVTITVTGGPTTSTSTTSTSTTSTTVVQADLSVTKTCPPGPVAPGAVITCSVTVVNGGPGTANTVSVTDTLPAGVTLEGAPAGPGFSCGTGAVFTCTRPTLAPGTSATFRFSARVQNVSPGSSLVNTVTVSSGTSDSNSANNTATATTTVVTCGITGAGDIAGTPDDDVICGSSGPDRIAGLGGNDVIFGLGGDDHLSGGDGNDTLLGGAGGDSLSGGAGNDRLYGGGGGVDRLSGDLGDDYLDTVDGAADDYLVGGGNTDTCVGDGDAKALCEL